MTFNLVVQIYLGIGTHWLVSFQVHFLASLHLKNVFKGLFAYPLFFPTRMNDLQTIWLFKSTAMPRFT
jgi:hypothetical protein